MGTVIKFNDYTHMVREKRRIMYEELVSRLKKHPANKYVVREAESLADEVLSIYGFENKSAPTPIISIAKEFGFQTVKADDIPEDISGNIFVGGATEKYYKNDHVIIVDAKEPLAHQRFIIAHELAHYLMDYIGNRKYEDGKYTFSKTYPKVNHDSFDEIRADRFAAEILMPKLIFVKEYIKAMQKSDYNKEYVIPYLATLFNTKESCIIRRIQEVMEG